MTFLISMLFVFLDFILFLSNLKLINWLKIVFVKFLKNQIVLMISIILVSLFFLNTSTTIAFNLAKPTFLQILFGSTGESILSHCNSSTDLLLFTILVGGSCLTYNLLLKPYVLTLAHTVTMEYDKPLPVFGLEPMLSSKDQRLNLNREDLILLVNQYGDQLGNFVRRLNIDQAYDFHYVKDFLPLANYQYLYDLLFRDHNILHEKLLPYINPACITNYVQLPNSLNGKDFISWNLVAKLNNNTKEEIVLSDLAGVVSERIFQLFGKQCVPLVLIPELICPIVPIVGYKPNIISQVVHVPTVYTNFWEQYIVSSFKFIGSFFF